jgi:hypothetical protein
MIFDTFRFAHSTRSVAVAGALRRRIRTLGVLVASQSSQKAPLQIYFQELPCQQTDERA